METGAYNAVWQPWKWSWVNQMTREEPVDPYGELEVGALYMSARHGRGAMFIVLSISRQDAVVAGYREYIILWANGQISTWRTSLGSRRHVQLWKVLSA